MGEGNRAVAVSVEKFADCGPGKWWFVHHPDGFLIECGIQDRAEQIAREINRGRFNHDEEPKQADPLNHASTSPGPVNCNIRKRFQGEAYPRTCQRCGLGRCPFFADDGNALSGARP